MNFTSSAIHCVLPPALQIMYDTFFTPMEVAKYPASQNPDRIVAIVLGACKVTLQEMQGPSRKGHLVDARMICAWVLIRRTQLTSEKIGKIVNRDRSNVSHYTKCMNNEITNKTPLARLAVRIDNHLQKLQ